MSGTKHRRKGSRIELEIVHRHEAQGVHAEKVPLSEAVGGRFSCDVGIYLDGINEAPWCCEVKARANGEGFKTLENWLGESDALFLRRDRAGPLVLVPWSSWSRLIGSKL